MRGRNFTPRSSRESDVSFEIPTDTPDSSLATTKSDDCTSPISQHSLDSSQS